MVVHAYNKQTTQKAYAGWPVVKKKKPFYSYIIH